MKYSDKFIQKDFEVRELNILETSNMLKSFYNDNGIDVSKTEKFSIIAQERSKYGYENYSSEDFEIPYNYESYIMQPLTLLRNRDGSYQLLDGFRRLFCATDINPEDSGIFYIFDEADFTEIELIYLLVTLNNPKFNGSNGYFTERGVALYFMYNYKIDLLKMTNLIYSYLHANEDKNSSWRIDTEYSNIDIDVLKNRIFDESFLPNLTFIWELVCKYPNIHKMWHIGQFIYHISRDNKLNFSDITFTKNFDMLEQKNMFSTNGGREIKAYDAIYSEFKNSINSSLGNKTTKTFTEKMDDYKLLKAKLDKDKSLTKIKNFDYRLNNIIKENGFRKPIFKFIIKPEVSYDKDFEYKLDGEVTINNIYHTAHLGSIRYNWCDVEIKDNDFVSIRNERYNEKIYLYLNDYSRKVIFYLVGFSEEKITREYSEDFVKR